MDTNEQAVELHQALARLAPHPGGLHQCITTSAGYALNQEAASITLSTKLAKGDIPLDDPRRQAFLQGFYCVQIDIEARWGGHHHDGTARTSTEVSIHVLDRLSGGIARATWHTRGGWRAEVLADDDLLPLLRRLLDIREHLATDPAADDWFGKLFGKRAGDTLEA
jgi:hypothetical protein